MIIKTNCTIGPYIDITPIKAKFNDVELSDALFVKIFNDNLYNSCVFQWKLGTLKPSLATGFSYSLNIKAESNVTCDGLNYTNWDGNNEFPFEYVANLLDLTIAS